MIIYKDLISGDEIISDVYKVTDVGSGLWEYDGKMVKKGAENFVLEGANPSAEGEDADEGGAEGGVEQVIDFVDDFRYNKIDGLDKKAYMGDVKRYMKALTKKMEEVGKSKDEVKEFQTGAQEGIKKIIANFKDYDVYKGESLDDDSMYILVNFREDGVTPFATIWKHGLKEEKV
ncbi:uncharacterized protein HMPREF1541_01840 [Cyphellophora europaea CBS 101466]|uniref:Translationally-controlled tumor protein homolog n=1 Tax=Cyphellophora europaea (strain CBS 101466) TaxID=1220924 RepID=W2S3R1_CYPE1|nr:uncharacterized protein HMPREF1541_01840 [Cyphellophora europaea CBS 101466]ETN42683.1 hypothetical protein HMPREF1541_01840 [Cyphellophora europaea CBS 101466]